MFYLPFELREIHQLTTPKGPDFRRAKPVFVNLGGNIVTLRLPRHKPVHSGYDEAVHLKGMIDIYSQGLYMDEKPIGPWRHGVAMHRSWRFVGPMFSGILARIGFSMVVLNRRMPKGESLFIPRIFEREVCGRLSGLYAEEKSYWASSWHSPVNWMSHDHLSVCAVSYEVVPRVIGIPKIEFAFPITHDCMVILYFVQSQLMDGPLEELDKLIDRSTMKKLCHDIIASTHLELSPESTRQLRDAQVASPNETLSIYLPPLKWTTPEEDEKHAYYLANPHEF